MVAEATVVCSARVHGRWRLRAVGVLLRVLPAFLHPTVGFTAARWAVDRLTFTVTANGRQIARKPLADQIRLVAS